MSTTVTIPAAMKDQLIELARRDLPLETVGLLGGTDTELRAFAPARNHSPTPRVAFYVEPDVQLRIFEALEKQGHEVVGHYHSHPAGGARPSRTDRLLCPEGWIMLIIADGEVRAWRDGRQLKLVEQVEQEDEDDGL